MKKSEKCASNKYEISLEAFMRELIAFTKANKKEVQGLTEIFKKLNKDISKIDV